MTVDAALPARRTIRGEIVALQVLTGIFLALRLYFDGAADLFGDEAYYWLWGQHLDWSYFDHPPLHAWMLRLVDVIFGQHPLSVRILTWFTLAGVLAIFWDWSKRLAPADPLLWFWRTTAIYLASLIFFGMTMVAYNDHLLVFLSLLAMHCFLIFAERQETGQPGALPWLYLAALTLGLAALTKYNGAFVGVGFAAMFLLRSKLRPVLATPHPWLAAMLALATQVPVIYWNAVRGMASFRFHFDERWGGDAGHVHLVHPLGFLALLIIGWSPFLIWPLLRLAFDRTVAGFADRARTLTLSIFVFSTLTLLAISLIIDAFFYWNIVALIGLMPLLTRYLGSPVLRGLHLAYGLVCAVLLVVNFTVLPISQFRGATDFGSAINFGWSEVRDHMLAAKTASPADTVGAPRYSTTSQVAVALGAEAVRYVTEERSQYSYWMAGKDLAGKSALILVDDHDAARQIKELQPHFDKLTQVDRFPIVRLGQTIYRWRIYRGDGFHP